MCVQIRSQRCDLQKDTGRGQHRTTPTLSTLLSSMLDRASDFPKDHTWSGKLKIVAKGRQAAIILMDAKNQAFAVCPVTEGAVEKSIIHALYL